MAFKKSRIETTPEIDKYLTKQSTSIDDTVTPIYIDSLRTYDSAVLVFVGDWHIGTVDFDLEAGISVLNYVIQTPNAVLVILGDMLNTAILNSVSHMYEDVAYPQEQWELFVSLFKQISDKCPDKIAVIHAGNHERRVNKQTGIDLVKQASSSLNKKEAYAPYFADTRFKLKCPFSESGYFDIPLITHHGDGGDPENFTAYNKDTLINAMGHTHAFQIWMKTIYDSSSGCKKDELEVVIPPNGGGKYGGEKGLLPLHKSAYCAVEVTPVKNAHYNPYLKQCDEKPIELAHRSINIMGRADTKEKQKHLDTAAKIIQKNTKQAKTLVLGKIMEIVDILKKFGVENTQEITEKIVKQILNPETEKKHSKIKMTVIDKFDSDELVD